MRWTVRTYIIVISVVVGLLSTVKLVMVHYASSKTGMSPSIMEKRLFRPEPKTAEEWEAQSFQDSEEDLTEDILHPDPRFSPAMAYLMRAVLRIEHGKIPEGLADYALAKAADPRKWGRYGNANETAQLLASKGEYDQAVRIFEELLQAFPERNVSQYALFLATTKNEKYRDPARAIELARRACVYDKQGGSQYDHEYLAIALAAHRDFKEAMAEVEIALSLPPANPATADRDEERLNALLQRCQQKTIMYSKRY